MRVEVRLRDRPQSRRRDEKLLVQLEPLARGQSERRVDVGHFAARVVENDRAKRAAACRGPIVLELGAYDDVRTRGVRTRRRHVRPPVSHVQRVVQRKPHVAIDAAPRIPAGVRLARVVDAHRHHVHARHEVTRDVVGEADVTVRSFAEVDAVDPDVAVHVHAVELQARLEATSTRRHAERLAIPADAAGEERELSAAGSVLTHRSLDAPVMREVHAAP